MNKKMYIIKYEKLSLNGSDLYKNVPRCWVIIFCFIWVWIKIYKHYFDVDVENCYWIKIYKFLTSVGKFSILVANFKANLFLEVDLSRLELQL